jgi:hypothetical protein
MRRPIWLPSIRPAPRPIPDALLVRLLESISMLEVYRRSLDDEHAPNRWPCALRGVCQAAEDIAFDSNSDEDARARLATASAILSQMLDEHLTNTHSL